jgi:hypothetical protein
MQPRNLPLADAVDDDDELLGEEEFDELGLVLDPQAARSPAAPSVATALSVPLTANLLCEAASCRMRYRLSRTPPGHVGAAIPAPRRVARNLVLSLGPGKYVFRRQRCCCEIETLTIAVQPAREAAK